MKLKEYIKKHNLNFEIVDLVDKNGNDIPERAERNQKYLENDILDVIGDTSGENTLKIILDIENE